MFGIARRARGATSRVRRGMREGCSSRGVKTGLRTVRVLRARRRSARSGERHTVPILSISSPSTESQSTLEGIRQQRIGAGRATSAARIEANRRNARRSTGPRTIDGKRRASRNSMKHGLCRTLSCLPSECEATFLTFVSELEAELRPATALQRITFNQIASLTWRLERLPEAQTQLFAQELAKVEIEAPDDVAAAPSTIELKPSDVLAHRFSDAPAHNGFALMERYERGLRSQLLRLMRHYEQLQKHSATVPYDKGEPPCPDEGKQPAWTEEKAQAQRAWCAEQERLFNQGKPVDPDWLRMRDIHQKQLEDAAREKSGASPRSASTLALPSPAKRTQSNPTENLDSTQPAGKCAIPDTSPVTERTHSTALMAGQATALMAAQHERDNPVHRTSAIGNSSIAVANRSPLRKMPHL